MMLLHCLYILVIDLFMWSPCSWEYALHVLSEAFIIPLSASKILDLDFPDSIRSTIQFLEHYYQVKILLYMRASDQTLRCMTLYSRFNCLYINFNMNGVHGVELKEKIANVVILKFRWPQVDRYWRVFIIRSTYRH